MYEVKNDTFVEQLVPLDIKGKVKGVIIALWTTFLMLAAGLVVYSFINPASSIIFIPLAIVAVFCAYYMSSKLKVEYEYINTNGEIDIDRITNKKKRLNMATFKCSAINNIEKYDPNKHVIKKENNNVYFACTPDENSVVFMVKHPKNGYYFVVLAPNDAFRESLKRYLPYSLKNNL